MSKVGRVEVRIEPELKTAAETVFSKIGVSPAEAIRMFYRQVEMRQGIPFEVSIPNKETLKAMRDADVRRNLKRYRNSKELFEDLGI